MARPLRIEHPGGWYHVTAGGSERCAILGDDLDRGHFLELVENMVGRFGLLLHQAGRNGVPSCQPELGF
jgi:hypothetical protein